MRANNREDALQRNPGLYPDIEPSFGCDQVQYSRILEGFDKPFGYGEQPDYVLPLALLTLEHILSTSEVHHQRTL